MHSRIDLGLILCAFGWHNEVRVADRTVVGRAVLYLRCVRCSRTVAHRTGRSREDGIRAAAAEEPRRKPSIYT